MQGIYNFYIFINVRNLLSFGVYAINVEIAFFHNCKGRVYRQNILIRTSYNVETAVYHIFFAFVFCLCDRASLAKTSEEFKNRLHIPTTVSIRNPIKSGRVLFAVDPWIFCIQVLLCDHVGNHCWRKHLKHKKAYKPCAETHDTVFSKPIAHKRILYCNHHVMLILYLQHYIHSLL